MPDAKARAEQLAAMHHMAGEAAALRDAIEHSPVIGKLHEQNKKLRNGMIALAVAFVLSLGAALGAGALYLELREQAKVNCKNNNESREANRQWANFILEASDDGGPVEAYIIKKIGEWTDKVYAERDCDDLNKEYKIPPRPDIKQLIKEARNQNEQR